MYQFGDWFELDKFLDWFKNLFLEIWNLVAGLFFTILGYFIPISNIVHALVIIFIVDSFFGYLAARKCRNEKFSKKIIFNTTVFRMLSVIILLSMTYIWDKEFGQGIISTPNAIGWFISGVLIVSISKNMYKILNWKPLENLVEMLTDVLKSKTDLK
jgi:hypothetical protein